MIWSNGKHGTIDYVAKNEVGGRGFMSPGLNISDMAWYLDIILSYHMHLLTIQRKD